jgi:hypothetical protein
MQNQRIKLWWRRNGSGVSKRHDISGSAIQVRSGAHAMSKQVKFAIQTKRHGAVRWADGAPATPRWLDDWEM